MSPAFKDSKSSQSAVPGPQRPRRRRSPLLCHLPGKGGGSVPDAGQVQKAPPLVGGLQQAEVGRQEKGLVHIQGRDQLPGQQVAAGIAGHHQAEQPFVIEPGLAEQGRQPVDERCHVGGQGIIVVWT